MTKYIHSISDHNHVVDLQEHTNRMALNYRKGFDAGMLWARANGSAVCLSRFIDSPIFVVQPINALDFADHRLCVVPDNLQGNRIIEFIKLISNG